MRVYFKDNSIHKKLLDVDDDVYAFLSKLQCSVFKKQIYLADDGYYEIKEDTIYRHYLDFNKPQKLPHLNSPELIVSDESWNKSVVNTLPPNNIKVGLIVERFKITDAISFIIERNDEESIDYYFEVKGNEVDECEIISFLSKITNVCVN